MLRSIISLFINVQKAKFSVRTAYLGNFGPDTFLTMICISTTLSPAAASSHTLPLYSSQDKYKQISPIDQGDRDVSLFTGRENA